MNTLNTIIEEEKGRFETVFGENLGLDEPFNNVYVLLHVKPMLKNFLTTAMQRAFEAGEREADAKWEREVEVVKKLLEVATCPDSSCNQEGVCIDGYGEPYQCQWCYERHDILSKIRS